MDIELLRQKKTACYMLLATVLATVVNVALLLGNAVMSIPYCASLPYYLVWLDKAFDNGLQPLGPVIGVNCRTGMLMCFVLLAGWLLLWWLCRDSRRWLKVGMWLVVADSAIMAVLALALFGGFTGFLLEFAIRFAVIWEIRRGLRAWNRLEELSAAVPEESQEEEITDEEPVCPD